MAKNRFFFGSHSFRSSSRTDLEKYSNYLSWHAGSKNVDTIFVGPGVQVQFVFEKNWEIYFFRTFFVFFFTNFEFFKLMLNLNPWTYNYVIYIFGICAPRRWIWVLLEVCTTTRTKTLLKEKLYFDDFWIFLTIIRLLS